LRAKCIRIQKKFTTAHGGMSQGMSDNLKK
jgi:hypothetical protein